ncbi:MAG TPA: ABC transporter substrate-binding protein [Phototrophicaceae bacterium]|nr:ABC transporter substrate-binding protein [Phototrophicaceae bacterium]
MEKRLLKPRNLIRLALTVAVFVAVGAFTLIPVAAQSELPVPRNETIFMEDTAVYTVFDSFNTRIPQGDEYANGYQQVGVENLFLANFATGKIEPWLATGYTYNSDYTELTIKLRSDVHWQDGVAFSSDDVVYTINTIMSTPALSGNTTLNQYIDSVSNPDATTVVIKLKTAAPRFVYTFFGQTGSWEVWPKHIWEKQDPTTFKNNPPVTTSVWKLKEVNTDLKMFIWERDDNYWDKAERFPEAKYVIYRQAPSSADADYQDFVSNNIDHGHALQWQQIQQAQQANAKVTYGQFDDPCPRGIWLNDQKYPLSLPEMHWVISDLVDRDKIANVIWQPPTTPADHPWSDWALLKPFIDPAVIQQYPLTFDTDKANAILDQLGFTQRNGDNIRLDDKGNPLSFTIITPAAVGQGEYQIAQDVADEAQNVGIQLTVKHEDGAVFDNDRDTGNFDITSHWLCFTALDALDLYGQFTSDQPIPTNGERTSCDCNWIGFKDPTFDQAVATIKANGPDTDAAKAAYTTALTEWMKNLPGIPVVQTIYVMPWNTTYWTGWPTDSNMFTVPFTWWATFIKVPFELKSTGAS